MKRVIELFLVLFLASCASTSPAQSGDDDRLDATIARAESNLAPSVTKDWVLAEMRSCKAKGRACRDEIAGLRKTLKDCEAERVESAGDAGWAQFIRFGFWSLIALLSVLVIGALVVGVLWRSNPTAAGAEAFRRVMRW